MTPISLAEQKILLHLARQTLTAAVRGEALPPLPADLPEVLLRPGAAFVTLTEAGNLRGCVGSLEAHQPLVADVREHAVDAALNDYRFEPVRPEELPEIHIELSYLTPPQPLEYTNPQDLPAKLRSGVDGVTLRDGLRRATFLPQVWAQLPEKSEFLNHLCQKMGAPADLWQKKRLEVFTYQAQEFHE
ncbi:MAG: AmmeMemoRadiSam system protein A [Anaerolineae bacterium CG_4_9_14_3_um_filter_57_17]|nr:AmmeMemoRadiSam system protein A [bacterium]NCT19970.1 AmmeMemoRadiSam system protein A [bacterium]OIO84026.1 MAG: hypothetical protein AUK01_11145 [Anaerolineae bacterium CG2_30_57_67]PJB68278.1 MAG: AmmeMemoRadiSam system protein A [Anaerolineae bacterium CG_4_9_14_3_um_filter_57_17]